MKEFLFSSVTWLDLFIIAGIYIVTGWLYGVTQYLLFKYRAKRWDKGRSVLRKLSLQQNFGKRIGIIYIVKIL
jgi:hypothetical protein